MNAHRDKPEKERKNILTLLLTIRWFKVPEGLLVMSCERGIHTHSITLQPGKNQEKLKPKMNPEPFSVRL